MKSLEHFKERIEVANQHLADECKAYKMDSEKGGNNMRKTVGLGDCHCCDYFLPMNDFVVLIEETRLLKRIENIRNEYSYLNDQDKDNAVNTGIRNRMHIKVYGAMLVLCRLMEKYSDARKVIQNKKYCFWLVASKIDTQEQKIFFDNLKDSLRQNLRQYLGKELLDDVEIISSQNLKERLQENANLS